MKPSGIKSNTKILSEAAVAVALAGVLNFVKIYTLPQAGSITAGAMVPVLWFALRRGAKWGVLAGVVFSFVVMLNPADFYVVHPVQLLLDYPIAFGALGLAGFFRKHELTGVAVGIGGRFLAHFLSGLIFFAIYAPQVFLGLNIGGNAYSYSALYNGSFMLPELVISLLVITVLVRRNLIDLYK